MENPRRFGGGGNFSLLSRASKGNMLYAGEAAGFQAPLFGVGMRCALMSGASAGAALAAGQPARYERDWKRRLRPFYQAAASNRWFYDHLGDRGYSNLTRRISEQTDVRDWPRRFYAPRLWKRAWCHLTQKRRQALLLTVHGGCDCTRCRCMRNRPGR